jgi:hypothetical protein
MWMAKTAELLGLNLSVSVATDIKITIWTISKRGKLIAENRNVYAKCTPMFQSVSVSRNFEEVIFSRILGFEMYVQAFDSKHGCACPYVYNDHQTTFESREEREMSGRPVDAKW